VFRAPAGVSPPIRSTAGVEVWTQRRWNPDRHRPTVAIMDGYDHDSLQRAAREHLLQHFAAPVIDDLLVLERGEGPYVFDTRGKRYIDALSSLICAQIGYSYGEEMAAAAGKQLATLPFNTNLASAHPPST